MLHRGCGLAGLLVAWVSLAQASPRGEEAEALYQRALALIDGHSVEGRRQAMQQLERATLLAPSHPEYETTLGRLYYRMGFLKQARQRFERVQRLQPQNADARIGLGQVWRRDYLKYLDRSSLAQAVAQFDAAARLRPDDAEPWLQLIPMLVEDSLHARARDAAERALSADSKSPEALLALGHTAYRVGEVERADSAFRRAIPRLGRIVRERFEDIAPLASEQDTAVYNRLPENAKREFARRFWREHDPDLTTPENEAQLEYWSRVTQAYFLFFDARRREWDQRGEVYVRYGPPRTAEYNPIGAPNVMRMGRVGNFPMNTLVWRYPDLGMTVAMQDRILSEYYMREHSMTRDTDPAPDQDSVAGHGQLPTRGGRGVFPKLPPNTRPIPVDGVLARFVGAREPRLVALLTAAGTPADSLSCAWVVLDSSQAVMASGRHGLSPSACDPGSLRVADFAAELPAGEYLVGLSVRDEQHGRGVVRKPVRLQPPDQVLELSDVVVSCGAPQVEAGSDDGPPAVRLTANPSARVQGAGPLVVYFEMYHLRAAPDGLAQVEFEYVVESAEPDRRVWLQRMLQPRRPLPDVSALRREPHAGAVRRQVVSVPVQTLPPGRYRLRIRVRDLVAMVERHASAEFLKVGAETGS